MLKIWIFNWNLDEDTIDEQDIHGTNKFYYSTLLILKY